MRRTNDIHIMLNDEEYALFNRMAEATGLNHRQLLIASLSDDVFLPKEYIEQLEKINSVLSEFNNRYISRCSANINQLAKRANTTGELPTENELKAIQEELSKIQKGANKLWQYIRLCLQEAREPTVH